MIPQCQLKTSAFPHRSKKIKDLSHATWPIFRSPDEFPLSWKVLFFGVTWWKKWPLCGTRKAAASASH